jgi:sec-independent protein translocase protein TatA
MLTGGESGCADPERYSRSVVGHVSIQYSDNGTTGEKALLHIGGGMSRLGLWEMVVIALVVAVFFGYKKLPDLSRNLGQAIRNFRRGIAEEDPKLEEPEEARQHPADNAGGRPRTGTTRRAYSAQRRP